MKITKIVSPISSAGLVLTATVEEGSIQTINKSTKVSKEPWKMGNFNFTHTCFDCAALKEVHA